MSADGMAPSETTLEAGGHVKGLAIAIVRQNKDSTGHVSVKVSYPWHTKPSDSYDARIAVPMAGKSRGTYFVPEVNDEVLVGFDKGDIRHPYVVGCLWNGADPSYEKNSDGKNDKRFIRSRKGHMLLFDDGQKGVVQLELNDGKKLTIDDDGVVLDDGKGNKLQFATSSGGVTLEAKGSLTLKGATVSVEATGSLGVKASGDVTVSGAFVRIN
jgi:uncharacterized protein involved in type VI secretion and phage assembly